MIQNIEKGRGFKGAVKYIFEKEKAEIIGGTMISNSIKGLTREAAVVRGLNPRLSRAVFHASLSIGKEDSLIESRWIDIADRYMKEMGFENSPYIVGRHNDTDHDHIHIAALRIDTTTGKTVSESNDFDRGAKIIQQIEIDYGLTRSAQTPYEAKQKAVKNLKRNELEMSLRTGEAASRQVLKNLVDEAKKDNPSIFDFIDSLELAGVEVKPAVAKTGRMNGFSFKYNDISFKASDLGKIYGWKKLSESVNYEQGRDGEKLIEIAERARVRSDQISSGNSESYRKDGERPSVLDRGAERGKGGADDISKGIKKDFNGAPGGRKNIDKKERRSLQGSEGSAQGDKQKIINNSIDDSVNDVRNSGSGLSDLAAPSVNRREESGEMVSSGVARNSASNTRSNELAPDHVKKISIWDRQHAALQSPFYRLSIVSRREGKKTFNFSKDRKTGVEKKLTADDVRSAIPQLRRYNAIGYDIYLTPLDEYNYYILLDDTSLESIQKIKDAGCEPLMVQETSSNNWQAIYKASKDLSRKNDRLDANKLTWSFNIKYGDDEVKNSAQAFRMSGFSNVKPVRANEDGTPPFVKITEILKGNIGISNWLQTIRYKTDKDDLNKSKNRIKKKADKTIYNIDASKVSGNGDIQAYYLEFYKREVGLYNKLWKPQGKEFDASVIDFRIVKELIKKGFLHGEIEKVILDVSPGVVERHFDPEDYARRTVNKAAGIASVPGLSGELDEDDGDNSGLSNGR